MVKTAREQIDSTLDEYFNAQLASSLPIVFSVCALSCLIFATIYLVHLGSIQDHTELFATKFALFLFYLGLAVLHRFRRPPVRFAHFFLTSGAVAALVSASFGASLGIHETFTDVVVIVTVAAGMFAFDYNWLLACNLASMGFWYLTQRNATQTPEPMEIASLIFASIASFLACFIRREAYQKQHALNHRRGLISEKLEALRQGTQQQREELEEQIDDLVKKKLTLEEAVDQRSDSVNELRNHIKSSRDSESLGRMAGGVAHDFNNLLTVLFFNLDELMESTPDKDVREDLREARSAAQKVTDLTSRLLALSRRQVLKRKLFNPEYQLQALRPTIAKLLGEDTRLELQVNLPQSQLEIYADPDLLSQALLALFGLGRQVERRGGLITVELSTEGSWLHYTIRHSGWAIPQSESLMIANPNEDILAAMGLSLSAVEGVVNQHQGRFEARSEKGKTLYKVSLPLSLPEPTTETPQETSLPQPISGSVVVLEEDDQVRRLLARFLRKHYKVYAFGDPEELKQGCGSIENAAVLICDYSLPQSDGPSLSKFLKSQWPEMKTIYMSGPEHQGQPLTDDGLDQLYLPKPFSLENLGDSVNAFVAA